MKSLLIEEEFLIKTKPFRLFILHVRSIKKHIIYIMSSFKHRLSTNIQKPKDKEVLVIEMLSWHDECLYSVCSLLKSNGYSVLLIADLKLQNKQTSLSPVVDEFKFLDFHSGLNTFKSIVEVNKVISKRKIRNVYFNTAQGNPIWKFFLIPFSKNINFVGTLHNISKLDNSFSQRFITKKIKRYVLLSEILLPAYEKVCKKPVSVFYPIIYPIISNVEFSKPEGEIWIVIPGSVDYRRRDYSILFSGNNLSYEKNIKFIVLGNRSKSDGDKVFMMVKEMQLDDNFIFFDSFVDDVVFQTYIKMADYILPLVHPDVSPLDCYVSTKISGTYNLAYAYKKPMLCEQSLSKYKEFVDSSFFYSTENFVGFINSLSKDYNPINNKLYTSKRFDYNNQVKAFSSIFH